MPDCKPAVELVHLKGCVRPATEQDVRERAERGHGWKRLVEQGMCHTCSWIASGEATSNADGALLFEDERCFAFLEQYPRGLGHTILIAKPHVPDIAGLSDEFGSELMTVMLRLTRALKTVTACDKVYQVTMCSGPLSHLHFQLIPRLPGEQVGGGVFSSTRKYLASAEPLASAIRGELARTPNRDDSIAPV
ncbi:MAG: HIT family protein [Gemmatimonadota bacterium]|nr:HIT family protein [Gemmatimonadota bacterium]